MNHNEPFDSIKPLALAVFGYLLTDVQQVLGIATMSISLLYTIFKFHKDFFSSNKNQNQK